MQYTTWVCPCQTHSELLHRDMTQKVMPRNHWWLQLDMIGVGRNHQKFTNLVIPLFVIGMKITLLLHPRILIHVSCSVGWYKSPSRHIKCVDWRLIGCLKYSRTESLNKSEHFLPTILPFLASFLSILLIFWFPLIPTQIPCLYL